MLFTIAVLVSVTTLTYASSSFNVTVTNCSAPDALGSLLAAVNYPQAPQINQAFTTRLYVYSPVNIVAGSYILSCTDTPSFVLLEGSVCIANDTADDHASTTYEALPCPITTGPFNVSMVSYFSSRVPVQKTYWRFEMYEEPNSNGRQVAC
eukprot:UN02153